MKLTITKIDEVLFSGEAESVTVPGKAGIMTILSHHMPIVSPLVEGNVIVRTGGIEKNFEVTSGILEVGNNEMMILV